MNKPTVVGYVKSRLRIDSTDYDAFLQSAFDTSLSRTYPYVADELDPITTTVSADSGGEAVINLTSLSPSCDDVRLVEYKLSSSDYWQDDLQKRVHNSKLYIRNLRDGVSQIRIWGLKPYVLDTDDTSLPDHYLMPMIWLMLAEFYDFLAGDNSEFNSYFQGNAGNAIEDCRAQAQYYENKAIDYLQQNIIIYGSQ